MQARGLPGAVLGKKLLMVLQLAFVPVQLHPGKTGNQADCICSFVKHASCFSGASGLLIFCVNNTHGWLTLLH